MNFFPIISHPIYDFIEKNHYEKFISKNGYLKRNLTNSGFLNKENLFSPEPIDKATILLTHSECYVDKVFYNNLSKKELRLIGLKPFNYFKKRSLVSAGGTLLASHFALDKGLAFNLAGGSHHAFRESGAGFCIFNDIAITINKLLLTKKIKKALIIDLDVHQGDGNAKIFSGNSNVHTASLHCNENYPFTKLNSDYDVGLKKGTGDKIYIYMLEKTLEKLETLTFDIVFYIGGVDVHYLDRLGLLNLTSKGLMIREMRIIEFIKKKNVPIVVTLGGGYSDNLKFLANLHTFIFKATNEVK